MNTLHYMYKKKKTLLEELHPQEPVCPLVGWSIGLLLFSSVLLLEHLNSVYKHFGSMPSLHVTKASGQVDLQLCRLR